MPHDFLIAPHLLASEIACSDGCGYGMHPGEFDQRNGANHTTIRAAVSRRLGKSTSLYCGSGCRCPVKNRSLWAMGAAKGSDHMRGRGMDLSTPEGMTAAEFGGLVLDLFHAGKLVNVTALGFYSWGIHLSVGTARSTLTTWGTEKDASIEAYGRIERWEAKTEAP